MDNIIQTMHRMVKPGRLNKIMIGLIFSLSFSNASFAQINETDEDGCWSGLDYRGNSCLVVIDKEWKKDRDRFKIILKNRCTADLYRRSCLERHGKKPSCEAGHLKAGKTTVHYTWKATGAIHAQAVGSIIPSKDWVCSGKVKNWRDTPW